jgi:multiple sugar transport system permease protein
MTVVQIPVDTASTAQIRHKKISLVGVLLTACIIVAAAAWIFPLYWSVTTSLKSETEVVSDAGSSLWPHQLTFAAYWNVFAHTNILIWYLNSTVVSLAITLIVVSTSVTAAYALSQLRFPGRSLIFAALIASIMVPGTALVVSLFVFTNQLGLINTWPGIVLPQAVAPVSVIIFKQFFDQIPKDYREAALLDSATQFKILGTIYIPMNWGIITAISITTFIGAWNSFLWPFLASTSQTTMTIPVGITQVSDTFGVAYARTLAVAVMAGLPVAVLYLVFQKRITSAIMLSAGIKG